MMKTTIAVAASIVLALGILAPGKSARAQQFFGDLTGAQENPVVPTLGGGNGTATFNPANNMLTVQISFSQLTGTTTDSHIHCCTAPGTNVSVALGFTPGFPIGVTSGTFMNTYDLLNPAVYTPGFLSGPGGGSAAGARDALLAGMSNATAYFNIHTTFRGGGEIRGNILPVPEPSTWALASIGLGAIGLRYARRKFARRQPS